MKLVWTDKQKHYLVNAQHRWNFKIGAVRSGKTFMDAQHLIPVRIRERIGLDGLVVIFGVTTSTIERNVLEPMRKKFGDFFVGKINNENKVKLFGEVCYCLGCEKKNQISKIQGASIKYAYGDEVARWHDEVFEMIKSRLDKPYSCFDGTANPEDKNHWLKRFLDSNADIFIEHFTIDDNPYLPAAFVESLKAEYTGVYYERYILGNWCRAEGLIYEKFAKDNTPFILSETPKLMKANIGIDFGGNGSAHTFVLTGYGFGYQYAVHLESRRIKGTTTPDELEQEFIDFVRMCAAKYKDLLSLMRHGFETYCDSAEQVLIRGFKVAVVRNNLPVIIRNARKMPIKDRIMLQTRLFGQNRLFFMFSAKTCIDAYNTAIYSTKEGHEGERLDDGSVDIDTMDASEYSLECEYKNLLNALDNPRALNMGG